eukprot:GILJ01021338.1.p1 GENE.GILJ01021338.1~~GILJ01021338.1.p1  ORF type:complete len:644 (+),score=87.32 GILJ01021338.1:289-1932(+)
MSHIMDYSLLVGIHHIPEGAPIDESTLIPTEMLSFDARDGTASVDVGRGASQAPVPHHQAVASYAIGEIERTQVPSTFAFYNNNNTFVGKNDGISAPSSFSTAEHNNSAIGGGYGGVDMRAASHQQQYNHRRVETDLAPALAAIRHQRSATFGASSSPLLASLPMSTGNHPGGQYSPGNQFIMSSANASVMNHSLNTASARGGVGGIVPPEMMSSTVAGGALNGSGHAASDHTGSPLSYRSNVRTSAYAPATPGPDPLSSSVPRSTLKPGPPETTFNRVNLNPSQAPATGLSPHTHAQQLHLYNQRLKLQQLTGPQVQGEVTPRPLIAFDPNTIVPPSASIDDGGVRGFYKSCFTAYQGGMLSDRVKTAGGSSHNLHEGTSNGQGGGAVVSRTNTTSLANSVGVGGGADSEGEEGATRTRRNTEFWAPTNGTANPESLSSANYNNAIAGNINASGGHGVTASGTSLGIGGGINGVGGGGVGAGTIPESRETREVYYIGIIDILQEYNARKTAETYIRSVFNERSKVSSVPAKEYAARFVSFMSSVVV